MFRVPDTFSANLARYKTGRFINLEAAEKLSTKLSKFYKGE